MLGARREYDDVRPVVGEHRLVPRDAQSQFRVVVRYPVHHLHYPRAVVDTGNGLQEFSECLLSYATTI